MPSSPDSRTGKEPRLEPGWRESLYARLGAWFSIRAHEMEQDRLRPLPKCPDCELWPDVPDEDCPICRDRAREDRMCDDAYEAGAMNAWEQADREYGGSRV